MGTDIRKRLCLICNRPTRTVINNGPYHKRCVKRSLLGGDGPLWDRSRGYQRKVVMEYNCCKTCKACDGRCGITINGECKNCHDTRERNQFVLHSDLERTMDEIELTGKILDSS